ncbi:MAG: FAD-binding oxidoreductase [Candidatus Marinimicrobia bacterium]|nr:FAD-binding oxidoreductase [Candidatus Neomarinimicrobiota bacterium]
MAKEPFPAPPPQAEDAVHDHKWGYADTKFVINDDRSVTLTGSRYSLSGYKMPSFLPYVEEMLGVPLDLQDRKSEVIEKPVDPPNRNEAFCSAAEVAFDPGQISFDNRDRLVHSHGQTSADEVYKVLYGKLSRVVDMVFFCQSEDDAQTIVNLAKEHDICLVPYGGGTSVSNALLLPKNETRMVVSIDMQRMNAIEWIDRENFQARVQAGITGQHLAQLLEAEGFMTGHEPDSVEFSTLGGWISTNASGMKKNRYGNIEQIIENITLITPEGIIEQVDAMPRTSMGMQPQHLIFGSEGNLGLITKAVLKIHKLPEVKKYGSLIFPDFASGVSFLYDLYRSGVLPTSVRLVDNVQFRFGLALKPAPTFFESIKSRLQKFFLLSIKRYDAAELVAATLLFEGSSQEIALKEKRIYAIGKRFGGIPGGSENGRRGYLLTFVIAYIRDFLSDLHVIGETFETSAPWDRIHDVTNSVSEMVHAKHEEFKLPGKSYVSYRITQTYHTGVCIYFMYGFYTKGVKAPEEIFAKIEHELRRTIIEHGGSISHHHGVGKLRKDFMDGIMSATSIKLLKDLKAASDPQNIFGLRNNIFADG